MIRPERATGLSIVNAAPRRLARDTALLVLRCAGRTAAD
jgi:hypothetical protein